MNVFGITGFDIFGVLFFLVFVLTFGMVIVTFAKGIQQWNKNNHSPRLTVPATIVANKPGVCKVSHPQTPGL